LLYNIELIFVLKEAAKCEQKFTLESNFFTWSHSHIYFHLEFHISQSSIVTILTPMDLSHGLSDLCPGRGINSLIDWAEIKLFLPRHFWLVLDGWEYFSRHYLTYLKNCLPKSSLKCVKTNHTETYSVLNKSTANIAYQTSSWKNIPNLFSLHWSVKVFTFSCKSGGCFVTKIRW